jgi:release factor glutamine methyltransferase
MSTTAGETWTVLRMLDWGTQWFTQKEVASPRLSMEWLLADALQIRRLNLYVQFDRPLSTEELNIVRGYVKRRTRHEPLQYITGSTSFYNVDIDVAKGVLIPRPETEELVERILNRYNNSPRKILDIGTGSGCIAVAIAKERPDWDVHGVDLSDDALIIANQNAVKNNVAVTFSKADLFKLDVHPHNSWDIIVSNPPYIHEDEAASLDPQVRDFEPKMALFCDNRLAVYESIARYAEANLTNDGRLFVELHLEHQIENDPFFESASREVFIHSDLSGRRRFAEIMFKK